MSVIMRKKKFFSKKLIIALVVILLIILGFIGYKVVLNKKSNEHTSGDIIPIYSDNTSGNNNNENMNSGNIIPPPVIITSINDYDGYWIDTAKGSFNDGGADLWVYYNDDNTISIELTDYESGEIIVANNVSAQYNQTVEFKSTETSSTGTIRLGDKVIELLIDGSSRLFIKASTRTITRRELFEEINDIIVSQYSKIDNTMFSFEESNDFLSLKLLPTCYLKPSELKVAYEGTEYIRDVYIIDKRKAKLINLQDVLDNDNARVKEVDNYIKKYIEIKKLEFNRLCEINKESGEEWPYKKFESVLDPYNYESKYFLIDEENQNVDIKVLPYPDEAMKALGDIWISVPFEICFSSERCNAYNVVSKKYTPPIDRDVALAYLKFIINKQNGHNMEDFGSSDTNSYNLIVFDKPELAIVDKYYNFKKYSYDDEFNIIESDDFNNEYTSIREKKYSPLEIKQVFCLSSDL